MSGYSKCPECGADISFDTTSTQEDPEIQRLLSTGQLLLEHCGNCGYINGRYKRHLFRPWRDIQIRYVPPSRIDDTDFIEACAHELGPNGQWNDRRHVFSLDELLCHAKLRERIAQYWEEHAEDGYECSSAKYSGGG